jgi:Amt family ammonium transporter
MAKQFLAAFITVAYSAAISAVILLALKKTIGLRVSEQFERQGLDYADHGESAYNQ